MLQDVSSNFYCGLLCADDTQCPSGSGCKSVGSPQVKLCVHSLSYKDWVLGQSTRVRMNVGFPNLAPGTAPRSGGGPGSFQVAKAYAALQSLTRRYGIAERDVNVLTVKELLTAASASTSAAGGAPAPAGGQPGFSAPYRDFSAGSVEHDLSYAAGNLASGLPGLQREVHDTIWNIEHITNYGVATELLRGVFLVALAYVVGGSLYKNQAFGAQGIDMIPHVSFWMEYPSLVIDGTRYLSVLVNDFLGGSMSGGGSSSTGGLVGQRGAERDSFSNFEPMKS